MAARESTGGTGRSVAGLFRREGEYWTIAYEGNVVRLKDAKGLHYLDHLLRHPGRRFHVAVLTAMVESGKERKRQLNGSSGVDPVDSEVAERARKAVTNRIRQAVARIAAAHERLGLHLGNAVHTGSHCVYTPEHLTRWQR